VPLFVVLGVERESLLELRDLSVRTLLIKFHVLGGCCLTLIVGSINYPLEQLLADFGDLERYLKWREGYGCKAQVRPRGSSGTILRVVGAYYGSWSSLVCFYDGYESSDGF
jgi:hypothetical protein